MGLTSDRLRVTSLINLYVDASESDLYQPSIPRRLVYSVCLPSPYYTLLASFSRSFFWIIQTGWNYREDRLFVNLKMYSKVTSVSKGVGHNGHHRAVTIHPSRDQNS
jgi:hypothetical protein